MQAEATSYFLTNYIDTFTAQDVGEAMASIPQVNKLANEAGWLDPLKACSAPYHWPCCRSCAGTTMTSLMAQARTQTTCKTAQSCRCGAQTRSEGLPSLCVQTPSTCCHAVTRPALGPPVPPQGVFAVARRFYLLFQHHATDAFLADGGDAGFLGPPDGR